MKQVFPFLVVAALSSPVLAHPEPRCHGRSLNCPNIVHHHLGIATSEEASRVQFLKVDPKLSAAQIGDITRVISDVDAMLSKVLQPPSVVWLDIGFERDGFFHMGGGKLRIAYHYRPAEGIRKSFEETRSSIAHEYAHVYFGENLRYLGEKYSDVYARITGPEMDSLTTQRAKTQSLIIKLRSELEKAKKEGDQGKIESLVREIQENGKKEFDLKEKIFRLALPHWITIRYNELFADIVAVLYADEPNAIFNAITYEGMEEKELKGAMARKFTNIPDDLLMVTKETETDLYVGLSRARKFLGENILSKKSSKLEKHHFLQSLRQAIQAETNKQAKSGVWLRDLELLNTQLIDRVR